MTNNDNEIQLRLHRSVILQYKNCPKIINLKFFIKTFVSRCIVTYIFLLFLALIFICVLIQIQRETFFVGLNYLRNFCFQEKFRNKHINILFSYPKLFCLIEILF